MGRNATIPLNRANFVLVAILTISLIYIQGNILVKGTNILQKAQTQKKILNETETVSSSYNSSHT